MKNKSKFLLPLIALLISCSTNKSDAITMDIQHKTLDIRCPYIKINKQDGRVLGIIHTK